MKTLSLSLVLFAACAGAALAHDTWVETNTNLIRTGDAVFVDLKLGNHGNNHRDFKLASKITLDGATLKVIAPDGARYDLRDRLIDVGYTPTEGYWTTKFAAVSPGLYMIAHTSDRVVSYAPTRSIKSAKTFFLVSQSLDDVAIDESGGDGEGHDRVLGHPLELVPTASPVAPMGPGQPIDVQLRYQDRPLAGAVVSFIPRGATLTPGFDADHERETDADGRASFTPTAGNVYLVVAHHREPDRGGEGHRDTKYSATLTVFVPELCPCCGE